MKRLWTAALALLAATPVALAHELACENLVNGAHVVDASTYPVDLAYELTVFNVHPTGASDVLAAEDSLYSSTPEAQFPAPFLLPFGASESRSFEVVKDSYQRCRALADVDGADDDFIDNTFVVTWDAGQKQCQARVVCRRDEQAAGPTRPMGFFKNYVDATRQCLDAGPLALGPIAVSSVEDALGLLWASPLHFPDGTPRTELETARLLVARQALAAVCTGRLFGTTPTDPLLVDGALAASCGDDVAQLGTLASALEAFNDSGDLLDLPGAFVPGPATPGLSRRLAVDPTSPGEECVP